MPDPVVTPAKFVNSLNVITIMLSKGHDCVNKPYYFVTRSYLY